MNMGNCEAYEKESSIETAPLKQASNVDNCSQSTSCVNGGYSQPLDKHFCDILSESTPCNKEMNFDIPKNVENGETNRIASIPEPISTKSAKTSNCDTGILGLNKFSENANLGVSSLSQLSSVEKEAKLYLDAFTRSAGLDPNLFQLRAFENQNDTALEQVKVPVAHEVDDCKKDSIDCECPKEKVNEKVKNTKEFKKV